MIALVRMKENVSKWKLNSISKITFSFHFENDKSKIFYNFADSKQTDIKKPGFITSI